MSLAEQLAAVARGAGYVAVSEGPWATFKVEGTPRRFETFANDERYARLLLTYAIPADVSVERLLSVANEQNRKTKAVKTVVYTAPEDWYVAFSVEMFFEDAVAWGATFDRSIAALRAASDEYFASLQEAGEA